MVALTHLHALSVYLRNIYPSIDRWRHRRYTSVFCLSVLEHFGEEGGAKYFNLFDNLTLGSIGKRLRSHLIKLNFALVTFWFNETLKALWMIIDLFPFSLTIFELN